MFPSDLPKEIELLKARVLAIETDARNKALIEAATFKERQDTLKKVAFYLGIVTLFLAACGVGSVFTTLLPVIQKALLVAV